MYVTDLCESKVSVDPKVVAEMQLLRNGYQLDLSFTPLYMLNHSDLKICYLNARLLHKHIEDVQKDINYSSADILKFTETRFSSQHPDEMFEIEGYRLFRNDDTSECSRPYHGTAIYFKLPMLSGYPCARNADGIEFTIMKTVQCPDLMIIGIYKSLRVAISSLLALFGLFSKKIPFLK